MAEQIKFGDRLILVGEKVILDNNGISPILESRTGTLVIGNQRDAGTDNEHLVVVRGNLRVDGTMTTVNTETITMADPFILLNADETGSPTEDVGIEVHRGTEDTKKFGWDESESYWTTYSESLGVGDLSAVNVNIDGDTNIGGNANVTGNIEVTGHITVSSDQEHQIGDFTFNQNVMSVVSDQMEIRSPGGISFYPDEDNSDPVSQGGEKIVWLRDGAKLVFEGTVPDDFEVKLQATDITEDRDIILPDESGTLATQAYVDTTVATALSEGEVDLTNYVRSNELSNVATTGSYNDLTDTPTIPQNTVSTTDLETVAFSGLYNDLLLKPALFSGSWDDITDKPDLFGGSYLQLSELPTLFDGQYSSLTGTPTIPSIAGLATETYVNTEISNLVNGADGAFDTLREIQDAMATDTELATAISNLSIPTNYMVTDADNNVSGSQIPSADATYDLGTETHQWNTIYGHTVEATYADLAERYEADAPYEPGTVLVLGGKKEVTTTKKIADPTVIGVVSTDPAYLMNSHAGDNTTHPAIALKGRVPCKVTGPVDKGAMIVTSLIEGHGMASHGEPKIGTVIGKAITSKTSIGEGVIEILVV